MRLSLLLPFLATVAAAQEAAPAPPPNDAERASAAFIRDRFNRFDKDGDGKLSAEEAKPIAFFVAGADKDGDGFMTLEEVQNHLRAQAAQLQRTPPADAIANLAMPEIEARFKQLDKNGDGKLIGDELASARWLSRLDANGDGLTLDEARNALLGLMADQTPPNPVAPPVYKPEDASPRQEPQHLRAAEAGIGRMIPDVSFNLLDGTSHRLAEWTRGKATVVALVSPSCPVSKRYLPTLANLERDAKNKGIVLLLVAPTATDTPEALRAAFKEAGLSAPCIPDPTGTLSQIFGATATTDAFVLDAKRTLVYRGAIDDQYGLGYSLDAPRKRYIADAIEATLAGQSPKTAATEAPGCALDFGKAQPVAAADGITYHNRISRVLQANCMECHRAGGVAPFPLETYGQVNAKAGMIRKMVERKLMPPWFAADPAKGTHSIWANDRSLSESDRVDLLAWLAAGKPVGNAADAPLARTWPGEWQIGKPDTVFQISNPIAVQATGTMPYQNVSVETALAEDRWVQAIEVQPTAREVVHHVLIFARAPGGRDRDDGIAGFFAAYVPGNDHVIYPEGFAKLLPAGTRLHFQIHYTPNGTATKDQVRIGMRYAAKPPEHAVQVAGIADVRLNIPPGADNHPESAVIPVPRTVRVLAFMPHMHVRGKSFRYEVILPGGETRTLLEVPRYDFNWQLSYRYAEPPLIPAGSKVRATGWFDNSDKNPANPDPKKLVKWGPQTTDEMMLGYVEYYYTNETPKVATR